MFISVILAAGEGTRMKSKYSKVGHKILNRPMIEYILEASEDAGVDKNIIIVGKNKDLIQDLFKNRASYKVQPIGPEYPYGTGYAVGLAADEIGDEDDVLVINGDCPLIRAETLRLFYHYHKEEDNVASVLSAVLEDPTDYGRIIRDGDGSFKAIVEEKDCSEEEKKIQETNAGIYLFKGSELKAALKGLDTDNAQGEIYITGAIEELADQGKKLGAHALEDPTELAGVNSKDQLAQVQEIMRARVNQAYMKEGVIMENPGSVFIEPGVQIGRDTLIGSGARITGSSVIGQDCVIEGDTSIEDSAIGDGCQIRSSYIKEAEVGSQVTIGPFAQLRPGAQVHDGVHIGNFVEIKKSTLGQGSKAGHHAYIGDASIGKDVNIGCGVIFANYDGKNKHQSIIGDGAFIGSNSTIVSPVTIEEDAFIAANSSVTEDVKKGALYLTRPEAKQVDNWVYRKRGECDE